MPFIDPNDEDIQRMRNRHETAVRALLDDQGALEALRTLLSKGAQPAHVHGAYSKLLREKIRHETTADIHIERP